MKPEELFDLSAQLRNELATADNMRDNMTLKHMLLQKYGIVPTQYVPEEWQHYLKEDQ